MGFVIDFMRQAYGSEPATGTAAAEPAAAATAEAAAAATADNVADANSDGHTTTDADADKCGICVYWALHRSPCEGLACGHIFHTNCLRQWGPQPCPLCRHHQHDGNNADAAAAAATSSSEEDPEENPEDTGSSDGEASTTSSQARVRDILNEIESLSRQVSAHQDETTMISAYMVAAHEQRINELRRQLRDQRLLLVIE